MSVDTNKREELAIIGLHAWSLHKTQVASPCLVLMLLLQWGRLKLEKFFLLSWLDRTLLSYVLQSCAMHCVCANVCMALGVTSKSSTGWLAFRANVGNVVITTESKMLAGFLSILIPALLCCVFRCLLICFYYFQNFLQIIMQAVEVAR